MGLIAVVRRLGRLWFLLLQVRHVMPEIWVRDIFVVTFVGLNRIDGLQTRI